MHTRVLLALGAATACGITTGWAQNAAPEQQQPAELQPQAEVAPGPEVSTAPEAAKAETASQPSGSRVMEEIVVTAQKREENQRDVPVSVTAFSGAKLEALGIDNVQDLPQMTPGLQVDNLVGYSIIFMRGVGSDIFLPSADSSVATYIDGIYTPFAHSLAQDFGKIKRIEVLKGPQGTIYGRNSTGGAINTVTAAPEREFSGNIGVEGGDFNARKIKAYLTGPITESVQFGFSFFDSYSDSYYKRPDDSVYRDFIPDRANGAQLKVNWDITDDLGLTLTGLMTRNTGSTQQILSSLDVRPTFAAILTERDKAWEADPNSEPYGRAENDMVYGELRWASPWGFDSKLLASHQAVVTDFNVDFDGDSADLVTFNPKNQGALYTTGEVQILSNDETWLADRLKLIGGYYFFKQRRAGFRHIELHVAQDTTGGITGPLLDGYRTLAGAAGFDPLLPLPVGVDVYFNGLAAADADAFFLQGTYTFFERLGLTLGGRYQKETKFLVQSELGAINGDGTLTPPLPPSPYAPRNTKTTNFSPKVTLDFKFPDDTLVFATWQKGFKSGTYQIANIVSDPEYVLPEKVTTYELGLKGLLFDGSFQYAFGAFKNTIKDVQVSIISLQNGGAISFENAGEAQIKGVDGDVLMQPLPNLLPGLVLTASGAYLDGEYTDYQNGSGFNDLGVLTKDYDHTGNKSVRTPKFSYNLGVTYTFDLASGVVETGVSYYDNDGYFFDPQNVSEQPSYSVVNARLSYLYNPWDVRLTVYGSNLENSEYFLTRFPVDFNDSGNYAPPRTIGARLEWNF